MGFRQTLTSVTIIYTPITCSQPAKPRPRMRN